MHYLYFANLNGHTYYRAPNRKIFGMPTHTDDSLDLNAACWLDDMEMSADLKQVIINGFTEAAF